MKNFCNKKVLLVEDDNINVIVFTSFIHEWGLKVEVARNGIEALLLLHEQSAFDLILMDIDLPLMNGIQTTMAIRSDDIHTPIIVVTGASHDTTIASALSAGANAYLLKPVSEDQLLTVVREWLSKTARQLT